MKTVFYFFLFGCFLLSTTQAQATATTHIWGPSTDVQAFKVLHITGDFYLPTQRDILSGDQSGVTHTQQLPPVTNLGLTMGILPFKKVNLEVGLDHKAGFGAYDAYPMYFNAKLGIPEKAFGKHFPALAVGILDVGTKSDATDYNITYGKAAYTIAPIGRFSLGYFSGNKKLLLDSNGKKSNSGTLVALERTMSEWSDKLWLCVEYMGSNSTYGTLNLGFAWKTSDNTSFLVGYDLYNDADLNGVENTITFQADIDLKLFKN